MTKDDASLRGEVLLHPAALCALALWAFNDHVLKKWSPGLISGKLSDVASQIFFPLLATSLILLLLPNPSLRMHRAILISAAVATATVMATIKTLDSAAWVYRWGLGAAQWPIYTFNALVHLHAPPALQPVALTMDLTDLYTLPAAAIAVAIGWHSRAPSSTMQTGRGNGCDS
jgi:hypothetical protein